MEFTPQVNGRDVTANLRTIALPKTSPSAGLMPWKIGYRIVSADGHPVTGLVQFAIGTAPTHPAASGISAAATSSTGDPAHPPTWTFLVLGIVLVLIATIAALLLRRRFIRRPAPAPSPNNPPNDK